MLIEAYNDSIQSILSTPSGPELVTNGDFPVGIADWTLSHTGDGVDPAWDAVNQRVDLEVVGPGVGTSVMKQEVVVAANTYHVVSFEVVTGPLFAKIGSSDGAQDILAKQEFAAGTHSFILRSLTNRMWIEFENDDIGVVDEVDNVSIRLAGATVISARIDNISLKIANPIEVTHPYTETQLAELKYCQNADQLYLFHRDVSPRKLSRLLKAGNTGHIDWELVEVPFNPPATIEDGFLPNATLTLNATSGINIGITVSDPVLYTGDVNRVISAVTGKGRGTIRSCTTGSLFGNLDISEPFDVASFAPGKWKLEGSPCAKLTPSNASPVGAITMLTLDKDGWRLSDVGRFIRVNNGVVKVSEVSNVDPKLAAGWVLSSLSGVTDSPSGSWSVESPIWSAAYGYPEAGTFFEQRLVVAGSALKPGGFWGSFTGIGESYPLSANDDNAWEYVLGANDVNRIRWLLPTRVLLIGTAAAEFFATGGEDRAITPTNIFVRSDSAHGSGSVPPIRVGSVGLFVPASGRELRELIYDYEQNAFRANDMLITSDHLVENYEITRLAYQKKPNSIVWAIRSDGTLLSMTYQREHEVVGWSRHVTGPTQDCSDGQFESITSITHWLRGTESVWVVVRRLVGGVWKRYIEYLDDRAGHYGELQTDSTLLFSGSPVSIVTGMNHLIGQTVQILGDGAVYADKVVQADGSVELDYPPASNIEVGLRFKGLLETLSPEITISGTSQGRTVHWAEVIVRMYRSLGCIVNGERLRFRSADDPMDTVPPLFTGDKKKKHVPSAINKGIIVERDLPLPLTVVGIFGTLGVGE
jgi:hypothetical protein